MSSSNWIIDLTLLGLILLSIVTWSIGLIKFRAFRIESRYNRKFLEQTSQERDWHKLVLLTRASTGSFAQLAEKGFATTRELAGDEGKDCDAHELKEILEREMRKQIQMMNRRRERGLAELASIGSTAPFIGLFGTVWGIMNAMITITATGQASIDVIAGPIGEALIATAVGIATAIPAVLVYNYFLRQQRIHVTDIDGFLDDFVRRAMRNRQHWGESC